MQQNIPSEESVKLNFSSSIDLMLNVNNHNNLNSLNFNSQLNSKFNNPETKVPNKIPSLINTHTNSMNQPLNAYKETQFTHTQNQRQRNLNNSSSPRSRPPLSPKHPYQLKNSLNLEISNTSQSPENQNDDMNLEINSAKNSDEKQEKTPKKSAFIQNKPANQLDNQNFQFSLALNQKMVTLQNKSNRLIQKVLAIQQQIQKYAQVQQKQLRPIGQQSPSSPLLQTKSLLSKRGQIQELDPFQVQHQQNIRKMNILGRNKVKLIQNLEIQIQNLQQKVIDPQLKKTQDIEQEKKEIDHKFINYYKHKNDILKQSKSQKFSFKHLKYLTKQNKYDKSECGDQIIQKFQSKQNQDSLETQLKKLKEQFSSYQQRTSKQLENYKERLNQNILQKEILKKQLQRQKYEHLKEKIFNKNRPIKSSKMISPQKTSRDYIEAKFGQRTSRQFSNTNFIFDIKLQEEKPFDQVGQNIAELMNFPKTDRPGNDEEPQFEDLEHFKDEVSMRYIEQNEEIQGLHEKIKDMDQVIEDLRNRLQKGHSHFIIETEELKNLVDEKQRTLAELSEINECNEKEIEDLKNQINDMNNYIFQCKEENELQSEQIQEYKNVIEQFVEQVKNLRNQLGEKNVLNDQLHQHIEEAEKINRLCENQINQLEKQNESLKKDIQKLENQVKLKEAKQRYTEALLQKQRSKQTADNSFISEAGIKNQTKAQSSEITNAQTKTIKDLKHQNQQKLDLQRIQFDKVLKEKDVKTQQLEQNLDQVKNEISHKVEQQVNEGIRTFLKYRKHTNHLTHQNLKVLIHGKKIYNGDQLKQIQFDMNFKDIKIQNTKNTKVIACRNDRSQGSNLNLRKLIDSRFNFKLSTIKLDELPFKLNVSLKLIQFGIQLIHQESNSQQTLSRSVKSSKKLPTLHPESIYAMESSQIGSQIQDSEGRGLQLSTKERVEKMQNNLKSYQFIYMMGNKKETESKKDKNLVYLSPEVLLSMNESEHSYCWTLGIIIDQIFNHRLYYTKIDEIVTRKDNYKYQGSSSYSEETTYSLKNILEKMVKKNFKERPTLNVVYQSFTKIMTQL